jgi:hypothetical protein
MRTLAGTILLVLPIVASSGLDPIAQFEGYYTAPASHCSRLDGEQLRPCDPPEEDCLLIRRIDATHATIDIDSVQSHGTECGVSGVAELQDQKLVYVEEKPASPDAGQGIALQLAGKTLKIRYLVAPESDVAPFCGVRARLDWLQFSLAQRKPVDDHRCGP